MTIVLPWAVLCRDNARHGLMNGRILLTREYREALEAASMVAKSQWRMAPIEGRVALGVTLFFPDKRRRDIGNYTKMLNDALSQVVYVDDSQIDELLVQRGPIDKANPRAEIHVSEITP